MSYIISYFYRFGDFAIDAEQRILSRGTQLVPLTPKVFDTLLVLVEQHGRIVSKDELMTRLWPDSFVEDSNLIFNIQQLRKALGDNARNPNYIETIPRRGYRFIADVEECLSDDPGVPSKVIVHSSSEPTQIATLGEPQNAQINPLKFLNGRSTIIVLASVIILTASISTWLLIRGRTAEGSVATTANSHYPSTFKSEKLTLSGKTRHAVISPDGQYIAYTFTVNGRNSIWLRQLATDSGKEIVAPTERLGGLAISHNGQHLYFIKGPPGSFALYRIALPLGGPPIRVIEQPQGSYSLSPDDRQIAFVRFSDDDKRCALMIGGSDGVGERAIAIHDQPDRFNTPAWSPDGTNVVVAVGPSDSGGQQVRVVQFNIATGAETQLTSNRWFHISRIVWLPDQSGLLIAGNKTLGQPKQLWRLNHRNGEVTPLTDNMISYVDVSLTADGTRAVAPQVTSTSSMWIGPASASQNLKQIIHAAEDFCWTSDGRIIYLSYNSNKANLWSMQPDGTDQRQLTYEGERNGNPTATADGRYIVFSSNRGGVLQIWRMESDGSNVTQLTKGTGHSLPEVSPDGRWIFYNSVDDWSLWRMSIDGGDPTRLTENYAVYPAVSPDGKLIASIGRGNDKLRKIMIMSAIDGKIVQDLEIGSLKFSAYRLRWSADGHSILFAASRDGVAGIYRQSLGGSAPEKLIQFDEHDIYDFGYSPKGHQLAVIRASYQFDVVLLSGLNQEQSPTSVASSTGRSLTYR